MLPVIHHLLCDLAPVNVDAKWTVAELIGYYCFQASNKKSHCKVKTIDGFTDVFVNKPSVLLIFNIYTDRITKEAQLENEKLTDITKLFFFSEKRNREAIKTGDSVCRLQTLKVTK